MSGPVRLKIVRGIGLHQTVRVYSLVRSGGRGPAGTIASLAALPAKPVVVAPDLALVGDSAAAFANKKATWLQVINSVIRTALDLVYALRSNIQAHGLIDGDETFSSATKSEHTASADSAADITLVLTTARPSMLIAVNVTTICTLSLVGAGITYTFPAGQTANLTDLAVGLWHIVPNTTDNGANVVVRVQQVS